MKSKKTKIILLLIIILFILLIGTIYYLNKVKEKTKFDDPKTDGVLNLSGFGIFFEKYSGELKSSEIASDLDSLTTDYLPNIYNKVKKYKNKKLEEYYNDNKNRIKKDLGIESFSEFSEFINKFKELGIDLNTWYRLDLIEETFKDQSDKSGYSYIEYEVSFKNDDKLRFSLYISKKSNKTPKYIINILGKNM